MIRRPFWIAIAATLVIADVALLVSGQRVLIRERHVAPGEPGEAEGFVGDHPDAARVECWYFTGRSIRSTSYWYSPNGIMGKDECPFLTKPN